MFPSISIYFWITFSSYLDKYLMPIVNYFNIKTLMFSKLLIWKSFRITEILKFYKVLKSMPLRVVELDGNYLQRMVQRKCRNSNS